MLALLDLERQHWFLGLEVPAPLDRLAPQFSPRRPWPRRCSIALPAADEVLQCLQRLLGLSGTCLIMVAGMMPGMDGMPILGGWNATLKYHRRIGHGLLMTLLGPGLLTLCLVERLDGCAWLDLWRWLQLSLLLHLTVDLL